MFALSTCDSRRIERVAVLRKKIIIHIVQQERYCLLKSYSSLQGIQFSKNNIDSDEINQFRCQFESVQLLSNCSFIASPEWGHEEEKCSDYEDPMKSSVSSPYLGGCSTSRSFLSPSRFEDKLCRRPPRRDLVTLLPVMSDSSEYILSPAGPRVPRARARAHSSSSSSSLRGFLRSSRNVHLLSRFSHALLTYQQPFAFLSSLYFNGRFVRLSSILSTSRLARSIAMRAFSRLYRCCTRLTSSTGTRCILHGRRTVFLPAFHSLPSRLSSARSPFRLSSSRARGARASR